MVPVTDQAQRKTPIFRDGGRSNEVQSERRRKAHPVSVQAAGRAQDRVRERTQMTGEVERELSNSDQGTVVIDLDEIERLYDLGTGPEVTRHHGQKVRRQFAVGVHGRRTRRGRGLRSRFCSKSQLSAAPLPRLR